jgi:nitroreductase
LKKASLYPTLFSKPGSQDQKKMIPINLLQTITSRRSVRRYQQRPVALDNLLKLTDAGRLAATGGNRQPWEFIIVHRKDLVDALFPCLAWLAGDGNPPPGMEPVAYIVILGDPQRSAHYPLDCAAAAQNILLAACALGLGSCWLGSVKWKNVRELLDIPDHLEGFAVISLGYPAQQISIEEGKESRLPERDEAGVLCVPKRRPEELVHVDRYGGRS